VNYKKGEEKKIEDTIAGIAASRAKVVTCQGSGSISEMAMHLQKSDLFFE
jgi:hypothetical protein